VLRFADDAKRVIDSAGQLIAVLEEDFGLGAAEAASP
jgi:hypothetical protein